MANAVDAAQGQPSGGGAAEAEELPLREFLAGHVLRAAMRPFEAAAGPVVKAAMQAHFPDDPAAGATAHAVAAPGAWPVGSATPRVSALIELSPLVCAASGPLRKAFVRCRGPSWLGA